MVFRPFYVQKEFLRKILSLPDFDFRDSDNTQTVILENVTRSSGTFFISGGYLRTVVSCMQLQLRNSIVFDMNKRKKANDE